MAPTDTRASKAGEADTRRSPVAEVDTLLFVVLGILSLTTLAAVAISFYLYRWRGILLSNPNAVVPEEWAKHLRLLSQHIGKLTDGLRTELYRIDQRCGESDQKIENLADAFLTLQRALDQRDAEIRRLKQGYDAEIFRRFLLRFIRVDQALKDCLAASRIDRESLEQARMLLADGFAECGLEVFSPPLGADFRTATGVADNPKVLPTEDLEEVGKIADVVEPGYRLKTPQGNDVVLPAKVRIYALKS